MGLLEGFAETLGAEEAQILNHVRAFIEWYADRGNDFSPDGGDDVGLRTYVMQLKVNGVGERSRREQVGSLRRFYDWSEQAGYLTGTNPFARFSIDRLTLTREQIRRRKDVFSGTREEREISRLRTLNQLSEQLNRSSGMQAALTAALETLLSLMQLQTAWAFLLPRASSPLPQVSVAASDRFALAAACGLPPGLEKDERRFLTDPKLCHCQAVMLAGQMRRAVNVVECTRLLDSADEGGDNAGLLFHASVPIIAAGQPLGIINVATRDWQFLTAADLQLLSAVGSQVAIALERARLYDILHTQRLRLERELRLAREIQDSLLPEALPSIPGYSLAADWRSALEMAGDFYDIFSLADGRWGIVVADVSDKGAAAAMYMAMARSLIRTSALNHSSPAAALKEVNRHLMAHSSSSMFVTAFYGVLEPQAHKMTYANAGHNPPLVRRADLSLESLVRTAPALGVFDELEAFDASLSFAADESLVIYTDGVTDAQNVQGDMFGFERLLESVASMPDKAAEHQLEHLTAGLAAFTGEAALFDDITFFIVELHAEAEP